MQPIEVANFKEEIMRYHLLDRLTKPDFAYMILTGSSYVDYYLFKENELEEAMLQLKKERNKGFNTAKIVVPYFSTGDRTWRARTFMNVNHNNKIIFDDTPSTLLHIKFYVDAGQWLNSNEY